MIPRTAQKWHRNPATADFQRNLREPGLLSQKQTPFSLNIDIRDLFPNVDKKTAFGKDWFTRALVDEYTSY